MSRRVTLKLGIPEAHARCHRRDSRRRADAVADGATISRSLAKPTPRVDGPLKATGTAHYTYDIELPGMLYGAILRSPWPHAPEERRSVRGEAHAPACARRLRSRRRRDPFRRPGGCRRRRDHFRHRRRRARADQGRLRTVAVRRRYGRRDGRRRAARVQNGSNVGKPQIELGDVEHALAQARRPIEATYTTPVQTHVSLETHGAVASFDGRRPADGVVLDAGRVYGARRSCGVFQSAARQGPRDQRVSWRRLRLEIRRESRDDHRCAPRQGCRRAGQADAAARRRASGRPATVRARIRKSRWAPTPRES